MHNFGRGMWRRVGDYERINTPVLMRIQKMQQYELYLQQVKRREEIDAYRQKMLQKVKQSSDSGSDLEISSASIKNELDKIMETVELVIAEEQEPVVTEEQEPVVTEEQEPVVTEDSKKKKKKNKK